MVGRLVLVAVMASTLASAQRGGGGGRNGPGGGGGMEGFGTMRPQRPSKMQQFSDKLKLNKEQLEEVTNVFRAALEKAGPLSAQLENGRTQIAGAMIDGTNAEALTKQLEAYTALEVQMDTIEADTYAKIFALLKPNQQSKSGQAFELMAGIFDRAAVQSGGGRRGR